jgi:hypothetical protein
LALLLALGGWSGAAPGGVSSVTADAGPAYEPVQPAEERQRPAGDRELPTSREASQRNQTDAVLKCWQYGRLILDEPDWKAADPGLPGPVLQADNGPYARMKLMPFGDTFCTLKHDAR